ncbi:MAG: 4'-phosphopantetheinyl transferase superfamily protein [Rhizobiaceae bacterium]|nr:4'-phosphopantetheinyl transferase superfamily protein [Hyphomicrobiales bacterium]NRB30655.1 4'-phosphopantetheinyl transferase superfamily protein [Rhizobiaceae bacterium]
MLLDDDEITEHDQFESRKAASNFALRRAMRRRILAKHVGASPRELRFTTGAAGKPNVKGHHEGVHFSASHGRFGGVVAISKTSPIGVDIEFKRAIDVAGFASKILSAEERQALLALDDEARLHALLATWTAKEAVIKALGMGLNLNLLPQIAIAAEKTHQGWRTATLSKPFPPAAWQIWTQNRDNLFSHPAIISIAAQEACEVIVHRAD